MSLDKAAVRPCNETGCGVIGRRTTNAVRGRICSTPCKKKSKSSTPKPSAAEKATRDSEMMAWLSEIVAYMPAAEDRMPDPVTRLGFADTLAWGVKTLRTSSPMSSVFDPAFSPPIKQEHSFAEYAALSARLTVRTKSPSPTNVPSCSSSSSPSQSSEMSSPTLTSEVPPPPPSVSDGNKIDIFRAHCEDTHGTTTPTGTTTTTTTSTTSTTASPATSDPDSISVKKLGDYDFTASEDGCTSSAATLTSTKAEAGAKDLGDVLPSGRFGACASLVARRGRATLLAPLCEHSTQ